MNIAYPFRISYSGRTATSSYEQHVRELIEQVLFTMPGERVNRPAFGSGLSQLIFAPNSKEYMSTYQTLIQGALLQWLGSMIRVQSMQITHQDSTIQLTLQYLILSTQQQQIEQFNLIL
jgi:phage baseplate assembly protein W